MRKIKSVLSPATLVTDAHTHTQTVSKLLHPLRHRYGVQQAVISWSGPWGGRPDYFKLNSLGGLSTFEVEGGSQARGDLASPPELQANLER